MNALTVVETRAEVQPQYDHRSILARAKIALENAVEIKVDVADVRPFEGQPRKYFNAERILSLATSIDAGGQTTPGIIRESPGATRYELIDGERRWRAVSSIPIERRPLYKALLVVADDDVVQFLISGVANFNREGHTALETLETIDRLRKFGFPMEEIAGVLGISTMWAYQIFGLKKLVPEVLTLLDPELPKKKQIPLTAAIHISKIDSTLQQGIADRVMNRDVSLGSLRTEVVKVAEKAGMPVRMREVDARKKLESALKKSMVISRTSEDLRILLVAPDLKKLLNSRPAEARRIASQLEAAETLLEACKKLLE